jgi:hypothetical protein
MGIFSVEGGAVSRTAYIAEGSYTFEMADTYRDGVCCQYSADEFKITVKEPAAETFETSATGCMSRTMTTRMRLVGRYRVSRPVLLLPRLALTKLPGLVNFSSHSVGLVPGTSL